MVGTQLNLTNCWLISQFISVKPQFVFREEFPCARQLKIVEQIALQNKQKVRIVTILSMHLLFGWQFISNSLVYFTFFSLMKHERLRRYVLISQFSTNIYAVDFMLYIFLKITTSYFWVTFSKTHLVAGIFLGGCWGWQFWMYIVILGRSEIIPMAADETAIGHIYTLLVVWIHVQWLSTRYSEDVYIRPWHTKG